VRQAGFNRQIGRNQALNHAGNVVGAAVSGLLGWLYGFPAVFWLAAAFGIVSIISVLMIPADAIDDDAARGLELPRSRSHVSGPQVLVESKPLLMLAAALLFFHLGNAAMLPLYGLAVVADQKADPAGFVAMTIVIAQGTMILTSVVAMWMAEKEGYWLVLLISFIALPVRGVIAAWLLNEWGVFRYKFSTALAPACRVWRCLASWREFSMVRGASTPARARS
jgi:MFS family permease